MEQIFGVEGVLAYKVGIVWFVGSLRTWFGKLGEVCGGMLS